MKLIIVSLLWHLLMNNKCYIKTPSNADKNDKYVTARSDNNFGAVSILISPSFPLNTIPDDIADKT